MKIVVGSAGIYEKQGSAVNVLRDAICVLYISICCNFVLFFLSADPCLIHYCGSGRQCVVKENIATCQCVRKCSKHLKSVCGDDGKLYPNHCELHRTSCVINKPIYVDHTFSCIDRIHGEL